MALNTAAMKRPERWQTPFDSTMTDMQVARIMERAPFSRMQPERFPERLPLSGILQNDARIVRAQLGDVLIREGDYGHSAFLVLSGQVRVMLRNLPPKMLGRAEPAAAPWLTQLRRWWLRSAYPEVRRPGALRDMSQAAGATPRIFLQDVPVVLGPHDTAVLGEGEVFGEMAALTRTPRSATVLADGDCELLELRWQGLRDILRFDPEWKSHVEGRYRANSLRAHLRETPLLARLDAEALQALAVATEFVTYGNFDWQHAYREHANADAQQKVQAEPLIAAEGDYPDGLYLMRNGFARLSRQQDSGERTLAYLGKGDGFGMRELARSWGAPVATPWLATLRAVGYADLLRIPAAAVERYVLPALSREELAFLRDEPTTVPTVGTDAKALLATKEGEVDPSLMEFLVEQRFLNGTAAMVIDLDRCTRCDECVKACAATHDNNPRFQRSGPKHERFMIAHACMHCADPVCMIGCPTGAIHREATSGVVVINDDTCIGCTTCANSCPYQNIQMVAIRNPLGELYRDAQSQQPILKATKCDLCLGASGGPACVRACPHDALGRVALHDVASLARWNQP
jgi:Fe-S-cluster-containing dehydrogenase component/CRP-like cAMP-binding protein